jgi:hypothetical protein
VRIEGTSAGGVPQSARFSIPVEAAAVDEFVRDLLRLDPKTCRIAVLNSF